MVREGEEEEGVQKKGRKDSKRKTNRPSCGILSTESDEAAVPSFRRPENHPGR